MNTISVHVLIGTLARDLISYLQHRVPYLSKIPKKTALTELAQMHTLILQLDQFAQDYAKQASEHGNALEKDLEQVEDHINLCYVQQEDLKNSIRKLESDDDNLKAQEQNLHVKEQYLRVKILQLEGQLAERRAHMRELRDWCWVPFYGQYLAGREVYEQVTRQAESAIESLKDVFLQLKNDDQYIAAIEHALQDLHNTLDGYQKQIDDLTKTQQELQPVRVEKKRGVVLASHAQLAIAELVEQLAGLDKDLETIVDIETIISSPLPLATGEAKAEEIRLLDAIFNFADYADGHPLQPIEAEKEDRPNQEPATP